MKAKRRTFKKAAAAFLAAVMVIGLTACGGGASKEEFKSNFTGEWEMVSMESEGETVTAEDLAFLGMTVTMMMNEDGSGEINMLGETLDFSWKVDSETQITVKDDEGASSKFVLKEGILKGESQGSSMSLKRSEGGSVESSSSVSTS